MLNGHPCLGLCRLQHLTQPCEQTKMGDGDGETHMPTHPPIHLSTPKPGVACHGLTCSGLLFASSPALHIPAPTDLGCRITHLMGPKMSVCLTSRSPPLHCSAYAFPLAANRRRSTAVPAPCALCIFGLACLHADGVGFQPPDGMLSPLRNASLLHAPIQFNHVRC